MRRIVPVLGLLLLLSGCVIPVPAPVATEEAQEDRHITPAAKEGLTVVWGVDGELREKVEATAKKALGELKIRGCRVVVDLRPSPLVVSPGQVGVLAGRYHGSSETIVIWAYLGVSVTNIVQVVRWERLRETLLHEILHHYDHVTGAPRPPRDHNEMFRERMRKLGWLE